MSTKPVDTDESSTESDTPMAHTGMTTDPSKGTTDTGGLGIRFMRWLVTINTM